MKSLLAALIILTATSALAETMQCRNGIVSVGDSKYDVLAKCGEPASKDTTSGGGANTNREEWTYDFGVNQFMYIVRFSGNRLILIDSTTNKGTPNGMPQ